MVPTDMIPVGVTVDDGDRQISQRLYERADVAHTHAGIDEHSALGAEDEGRFDRLVVQRFVDREDTWIGVCDLEPVLDEIATGYRTPSRIIAHGRPSSIVANRVANPYLREYTGP